MRAWSRDPWVVCCALGGALLLAWSAILTVPWLLWVGWCCLAVVAVLDVGRDPAHTRSPAGLWQTRGDE